MFNNDQFLIYNFLLQNSYELLLQELKVLFLQTRNNSHALYWAIIKETHNHQTLVEAKSKGIIARAGYFYNSLRDKFNKSLKDLVKAYKTKYTSIFILFC